MCGLNLSTSEQGAIAVSSKDTKKPSVSLKGESNGDLQCLGKIIFICTLLNSHVNK
jgi:hypothetical protein